MESDLIERGRPRRLANSPPGQARSGPISYLSGISARRAGRDGPEAAGRARRVGRDGPGRRRRDCLRRTGAASAGPTTGSTIATIATSRIVVEVEPTGAARALQRVGIQPPLHPETWQSDLS